MTLIITGLSVSLQFLVKLGRRLFWELLKNTGETRQSLVTANTGSQGEDLVNQLNFPLWKGHPSKLTKKGNRCEF